MRSRKRVSKSKSNRIFRKGRRTKSRNRVKGTLMRGGYRL